MGSQKLENEKPTTTRFQPAYQESDRYRRPLVRPVAAWPGFFFALS
jgi:hypothetical protein